MEARGGSEAFEKGRQLLPVRQYIEDGVMRPGWVTARLRLSFGVALHFLRPAEAGRKWVEARGGSEAFEEGRQLLPVRQYIEDEVTRPGWVTARLRLGSGVALHFLVPLKQGENGWRRGAVPRPLKKADNSCLQGNTSKMESRARAGNSPPTLKLRRGTPFSSPAEAGRKWVEARGGIEPPLSLLQREALPLCYRAIFLEGNS